MSNVPNSGLVPLEQRAALFRAMRDATATSTEEVANALYENVQQLLDERDQYGQDAYHDGQRADAAESDLIHWSYRIDAVRALAESWDFTDEQIDQMTSNIDPLERATSWLKLTTMRAAAQELREALQADPGPEHVAYEAPCDQCRKESAS